MKKTILITGASRGIGAATALLAAQRGYDVAINYLTNEQAALRIVDAINHQGGNAKAFAADISREKEVVGLFKEVDKSFGTINALVNNAGILEKQMRLEDMESSRLERVFAANVIGSFMCAREAIKRMSSEYGGKGGGIVNVSSGAARHGAPGEYVDYAASKAAIDAMTIGLAKEVAEEGIRVNAVRPGLIYTDIHASGGEPGRVDRAKVNVPMKRGGQPAEVAAAILWLLSDEASYCTGTFIDITGGR